MMTRTHTIRCGHCRATHASVEQVRLCSATGGHANHLPATPVAPWDREQPAPRPRRVPVTEDGIYLHDGEVYKVQVAKQGSGRLYAKRLQDGAFIYAPGAVRHLSADERMTLERAQEYGRLYGICCRCGAELTDEVSIEAGIGPICATKF